MPEGINGVEDRQRTHWVIKETMTNRKRSIFLLAD